IYSFFAFEHSTFRRALVSAAGGEVSFHSFRPPGEGHIGRLYLESIDAGEAPVDSRIDVMDADVAAAERAFASLGANPEESILVFPGSGSATKNWPFDRFVRLAREVESIVQPIMIFGPAEESMARSVPDGIAILKDLPLEVVAALARVSGSFIGNDSG